MTHAQANLDFGQQSKPQNTQDTCHLKLDIKDALSRCPDKSPEDPSGLRLPQEAQLKFGARWRCVVQTHHGKTEAVAKLRLPKAFENDIADFGLHPGLLDMATGFAIDLAAPEGTFWAPMSYRKVNVYANLTAELWSWMRLSSSSTSSTSKSDIASFDITLADKEGNIVMDVEALTMRRLTEGSDTLGQRALP